ncbi:MAG: type II secretion system protein GspM [Myxococcota bacterium]
MAADPLAGLRSSFENLNERERKLVGLLGAVFLVIVVVLPMFLMSQAIGDIEDENREIVATLRAIQRGQSELAARRAVERASQQRYATPAPPLGSFIEARAQGQDLRLREVTDQPEQVIGEFTRRNVRATLPQVELRRVMLMLADIENSRYPVAIERLQIEHFRQGATYNVQLGVIAYDAAESEGESGMSSGMTSMRGGRAGPPRPR